MIADRMFLLAYCVNYQEIENYEEALNDPDTMWVCHHKDEIELNKSRNELIEMGLYYNIAPEKLIFLRLGDHLALHNEHKKRSGWKLSEEARRKISEALKGRKHSDETKQKIRDGVIKCGKCGGYGGKRTAKKTELIDTRTNKKKVFNSKGECMAYLKISSATFSKLVKNYKFIYNSKLRFYKINILN